MEQVGTVIPESEHECRLKLARLLVRAEKSGFPSRRDSGIWVTYYEEDMGEICLVIADDETSDLWSRALVEYLKSEDNEDTEADGVDVGRLFKSWSGGFAVLTSKNSDGLWVTSVTHETTGIRNVEIEREVGIADSEHGARAAFDKALFLCK